MTDFEERPVKKRRFFVEDPPESDFDTAPNGQDGNAERHGGRIAAQDAIEQDSNHHGLSTDSRDVLQPKASGDFDNEQLQAFIGEELRPEDLERLRSMADNSVERGKSFLPAQGTQLMLNLAINMYLDGSFQKAALPVIPKFRRPSAGPQPQTPPQAVMLDKETMPDKRYIGAFGVACWATTSGTDLIRHGESITIGRAKPQLGHKVGRGGKVGGTSKRQDTIVRVLNSRGDEVARLETETAYWISPLLDQIICHFQGSCVFAPERVRTNDTMYIQLHAFILSQVFEDGNKIMPMDSNRETGIFEAKETQAERNLHLRQLALVKLFDEISLHPVKSNTTTEQQKKQGLLKAAETAELHAQRTSADQKGPPEGGSSPPSEDAEEGEELEQDQLDTLYKKAQSFDFDTPEHDPAPTFAMNLRKYQKQALHWMINKERDSQVNRDEMSMHPLWEEYAWPVKDVDDKDLPIVEGCSSFYVNLYSGELSIEFPVQEQNCLGGILADEMGLGKTIEMLALMHSHKSDFAHRTVRAGVGSVNDLPRMSRDSSAIQPAPCTTLVVAPMSLLAQWASEAERASKPGTAKVLVYYGGDRALNLQSLCCEANAASAPNVIVTSYGTVLSEYTQIANSGGNRGSSGGLFSLSFFRVILDEAHTIKNRQAKTSKACYEIHATHRWVLTGTPIVNRLEDLFSLVHFLKVEPWSNFSYWKTFITVPFESGDYIKALDVVQTVLEPLVLRRTKDMKTPNGEPLVPLPLKTVEVERVQLSQNERDVYNFIFARAKRTFSANVEAGTLMKSYTAIFAQILRLRQACCHPVLTRNKNIVADEEEAAAAVDVANGLADDMDLATLVERFETEDSSEDANRYGAHALKQIQDEAENECPICAEEPMIEQAVTGCWHSACKKCLIDYIDHQRDKNELPRCFNCREPINIRDIFEVHREDEEDKVADEELYSEKPSSARVTLHRINQPTSAKISALLEHLKSIRRTSPLTKSVIFSQFTSFLDLIQPYLTRARIPSLRFDGSMAQKARAAVISEFTNSVPEADKNKRGPVLLLSLKAGGVGLNLTAADRVFMMDPWWSWAVEAQAIDRVHRMGQEKEVKVVRFVCEESIEEKMLRIQERKKFM